MGWINRRRPGARGARRAIGVGALMALAALLATAATSLGASTAAAGLSQAGAATKAAESYPTSLYQTPLKSKPTSHLIVFMNNQTPQSADLSAGVSDGAKLAGWKFKSLNFDDSNPSTLITDMQQALQYKPYAVVVSSFPESLWKSQIPAYKKAGVKIIALVVGPGATSPTVPVIVGDFTNGGKALGDWFVSNSKGKGQALMVDIPSYPILTESKTGANQVISSLCPACKVSEFEATLAEVSGSTLVPDIVTALKKNPSIHYVLDTDLLFIAGLSEQLKAAGLTDIQIAGTQPEPSDLAAVKSGTEAASVVISNRLLGWLCTDSALRLSEGMKVPAGDGGIPSVLLVKSNIKSTALTAYNLPSDYAALFAKLWKVN
jgi:ribose transport system substrate-binding protein